MGQEEITEDLPEEAVLDLAAETLTGDVRDTLLTWIRSLQKPWQQMSEKEQQDLVYAVSNRAETLVRHTVAVVAGQGRKVMVGVLESVAVKDGIKAVIKLSKNAPDRHELFDAQSLSVMVVVADPAPFQGERAPVPINKDQPDLIPDEEEKAAA